MSGSIGGDRIRREDVLPTVDKYIKDVLKNVPGYVKCAISGSYNAGTKSDHGDIDLIVLIEPLNREDTKKLKQDFKKYIDNISDEICPPFRSEKYKGLKSKIYGTIVTCQVPIVGQENKFVQVDNCIVNNNDEFEFKKAFLDLEASKQCLITALVRVLDEKQKYNAYMNFELSGLPLCAPNEELEFVLSTAGLSLRQVTLDDNMKQIKKVELWRTNKWKNVEWLLRDWDLSKSYNELLQITAEKIKDERSRKRICGVMKSMVVINPGEEGTPKGIAKEQSIIDAYKYLNV